VVNQIIRKYPLDHTDDEGIAFWSGNKIYPIAFEFDVENNTDIDFVVTFSHIWADAMGIPQNKRYSVTRVDKFVKFLQRLNPPKEVRCKDVGLDDSDTVETKSGSKSMVQMIEEIANLVVENKQLIANMQPISFEKDDDTNNHIDFITNFSNKRAANYRIEPKDRLTTKSIAGKIIPAIATTTSVTAGLVSLELYKTIYGQIYSKIDKSYNTIERYRYGSFNLAVQSFGFSESYPTKLTNIDGQYHSIWTRVDIDADTDLESVINAWSDVSITKLVNNKPTPVRMNMDCLMSDHGILYSGALDDDDTEDTTLRELILRNDPDAKGEQLLMMTFEEVVDSDDDDVSGTDLQKIDNDSVVTVRVCL